MGKRLSFQVLGGQYLAILLIGNIFEVLLFKSKVWMKEVLGVGILLWTYGWFYRRCCQFSFFLSRLKYFLLAFALVGKKDIVFRFIIEYSSLRDFWPLGNNRSIFYIRIFEKWYFGLCWNLRLVIIELWYVEGFWFLLEDLLKITFLHAEIFEFP